ncbi:cryptochrome-2 [Frankliniella occidentalis]|uniref:Cryptochrome-2 n=1 Tax=Frankliniella occidentalis TaxID=133901 RepID=A0A6J1TKE3_FRAOC|nr:cryptochrome-2 [Frankliniella occidentalis]XP_026293222.2 cryptochrome-2 [Frankliniella occidentalis]
MSKATAVHWFRKGLRLHDNPALVAALKSEIELRPVYIFDPWYEKNVLCGPNRWRFLHQSLTDLDKSLRDIGSRLFVFRGTPEEVFTSLFSEWKVQRLTFEIDIEPYALERDEQIIKIARQEDVEVIQKISHTLYNTELVLKANMDKPPLTYQKLVSLLQSLGEPPEAVAAPKELLSEQRVSSKLLDSHDYDIPTLEDLGVDQSQLGPCLFPGGETEGLARLGRCLERKEWISTFEKPKTIPNSLSPSTTVLSPYIRFGCVSSRLTYHKINEILKVYKKHSKPPVSLIGQMYWREFYYVVASATPNFDKMIGNKVCCAVPWDENPEFVEKWAQAQTGYPFIDACMRQLRQEGWIHHLARHAVACFLTRGDLYQSWEVGQKVFEELLLDADWALNAGNWMWMSASAFYHQFYRVYSPVAFGKKTDVLGQYIRKYVPEVAKLPTEYLYEPWKASLAVQKGAKCVLGKDYPHRIIIHEDVYKNNIGRLSAAYKANKLLAQETLDEDDASSSSSPPPKRKKGAKK